MRLILGLGNPEDKYAGTRHNVGFIFADKLKEHWAFPAFAFNKNFNAEISKGTIDSVEVMLAKPQTFMNLSGVATQAILSFYKLTPNDILVIHDDLDIALGKYKLATDSSAAGHNGVRDIIEKLGTQKFHRVRVGIGQEIDGAPVCRLGAHDFVLGKFSADEAVVLSTISKAIIEEIEKIIAI